MTPELYEYMLRSSSTSKLDTVLERLRLETAQFGEDAIMQISGLQGKWLSLMIQVLAPQRVLEIGTFTGYSSLCMAMALPDSGHLTCLDLSEQWTGVARKFWAETGLDAKIDLLIGPALSTLEGLPKDEPFDFIFVDAEKTEYDQYYELSLPRLRSGGVIVFDNMLRDGRVVDFDADDLGTAAIDQLNRKLAVDDRIECVLLPIADGIQFCRKK